MKKRIYQTNDRVEYYVMHGKQRLHRIGYIKGFRAFLFWGKYYICHSAGTHEIDIVKESQIFGKVINNTKKDQHDN